MMKWATRGAAVGRELDQAVVLEEPQCRSVVHSAGHMLPFDDIEGFLAPVREFVARVTRRADE